MKTNPPMTVEELRARRVARGADDPLTRLSKIIARAVDNGSPVVTEMPSPECIAERARRAKP